MNAINTHIKLYKLGYINLQYMYAMNTCAVHYTVIIFE